MEITPQNLRNLFVGYRANFQGGLNQAESMYQQLATVVPSTTGSKSTLAGSTPWYA